MARLLKQFKLAIFKVAHYRQIPYELEYFKVSSWRVALEPGRQVVREHSAVKSYTYLPAISDLFTATLLISNVLNGKVLSVGPLSMAGGILLWPLGYLFSDLQTEVIRRISKGDLDWLHLANTVGRHDPNLRRATRRSVVASSGRIHADSRTCAPNCGGFHRGLLLRRVQQLLYPRALDNIVGTN
jgi:hypothetical protein